MPRLIILLRDQLSHALDILQNLNSSNDIIALFELREEATYVKHHPKKIAFWFASMRHFAQELIDKGFKVVYVNLNDPSNTQTLATEILRLNNLYQPSEIFITEPSEYHGLTIINQLKLQLKSLVIFEDKRFLCSKQEFSTWISDKKQPRMEFFYRIMRQKYQILLEKNGLPVGGKWNYDHENRKSPPSGLKSPPRLSHKKDQITQEVLSLVKEQFADHPGKLEPFFYALNNKQALKEAKHFIDYLLKNFGDYQDAMVQNEVFLYHSLLATYLNSGLLNPLELCKMAEQAFYDNKVSIAAAEGFIRQILGWREYVRGIYWHFMPNYKHLNYFNAERALPDFFWTGETKLNCVSQAINHSLNYAYSHHIQRLMITGNFALLAGLNPKEVCEWYLIIYSDAYEWVELPNTLGMALFGDGGILASKPYAASGNYINKMSNFCQNCQYDPKISYGAKACPFNYLYWNFFIEHEEKLIKNHRLAHVYPNLKKMTDDKKMQITLNAQQFLKQLT